MKVAILTEQDMAQMIQQRTKSRDWWVIVGDFDASQAIREIEDTYYTRQPGDFELSMLPPIAIAFARKRQMSAKQLARILRRYGSPFTEVTLREQDIICCGGDLALTVGWAQLQRWLTMPIAAAEMARV